MWVWKGVRPNILRLSYILSPCTCEFGMVPNPNIIGLCHALSPSTCGPEKVTNPTSLCSVSREAQLLVGLVRRQTLMPWVQLCTCWAQMCMDLTRYYTHDPWVWSHSKLNTYRVYNFFRFHVGSHEFVVYSHVF
jgi:hypothetical protein